jgi:hypothetical protein
LMASARSSFPPLALLIRSPLLPWPTPTVSRHTPLPPEGPRHPHPLLHSSSIINPHPRISLFWHTYIDFTACSSSLVRG